MCGILGIINKKTERSLASYCLDKLRHRGPDGSGLWQEGGVTLGHRRLAILDTSENGDQPMFYGADDRYAIIYNGEIYNFIEIRNELISLGYSFKSDSDSEVILASFIEWKEKCLERFNGMWAFIIWDRLEKRAFISRDRFGVKPLYYINPSEGGFAFASEMKALMPLLKEIRANRRIVCDPALTVFYEATEECVIEGIKRFPAGSCAWLDDSGIRIKRWWNTLDNLITDRLPIDYEGQVEEFRELFLDACRLRMRSDVTIGTALSGGLDSSAVICSMAHLESSSGDERMNKDCQHAYVATFPGTTMDESVYAKKVTDHLGIRADFVEIDPLKAIDGFDEMIYLFEDVYLTSPIPMMLLYGALKKDGTTVTIDGHGADELFGGYTFDFINALKDASSKEERDMVLNAYIDSFPKDGSNMALKNGTKTGVYLNFIKRSVKDRLLKRTGRINAPKPVEHPAFKKMDTLNKILYRSSHENILPTLLRNYDRYSMANGVEIRMPFMDYRIVCFAMSVGFKSKLHGGYSKSIIRDAIAPYMPESISYRKTKIGFNTPVVEWMKGPLREYFTDTVNSSDFKSCELIDPKSVKEMVMGVIDNEGASFADGEKAFSSLYPYLWEKNMIRRKP